MTRFLAPVLLPILVAFALIASYAYMKTGLFVAVLTAMGLFVFYYAISPATRRELGYKPIVVALAMPLAAWAITNIWLLYAVMLMLLPLGAQTARQVAPLYIFSLLLLPNLETTVSLGSLKLFDLGVHDALALGGTIRLMLFVQKDSLRVLDVPLMALLLLLVTAIARDTSFTNFIRVLTNMCLDYGLPYYIVSRSIRSMDDARFCMTWLCAVATIISVILLYEVAKSWPLYNNLYDRYGIHELLLVKSRGGFLRAGGPFLESTSMAMVMTFCFLAAWLSRSAFRSKIHHWGILVILLAGVWAPQSRGAWIGLFIGMVVVDLHRGRMLLLMQRLGWATAGVVVLLSLAQISPYASEAIGLSGGSADTGDYRERLLERGIEEFKTSPITGYSLPELMLRLSDLRQGEGIVDFVNTYLYIGLVSGIIGLVIFVSAFLSYIFVLSFRLNKPYQTSRNNAPIAFVCAGLVATMEMLFFTSFGGRPAVFVFLFFAMTTAMSGIRHPAARSSNQKDKSPPPIPLTHKAETRH